MSPSALAFMRRLTSLLTRMISRRGNWRESRGPLPGHARRSLLNALNEMPGVGSPKWLDAIKEILAKETARAESRGDSCTQAEAAAKALSDRLSGWFGGGPAAPNEGGPAGRGGRAS